jgi:hypothetical protein
MNELDSFLDKLETELGFLDAETAKDIKEEIRSHILDSAEASGRPVQEIIGAMGSPEEIARRYRDEFRSSEEPRRRGVRIEFSAESGEGRADGGCGGEWRDHHHHRFPHGPWEEMGKAFGEMGRDIGRMAREWAHDAERAYDPRFREYGRQMRDFFKESFSDDEGSDDARTIELRYPKARALRFDFTRARITVKKGSGDEVVMRVKLRGSRVPGSESEAAWKPTEERSGDDRLSISEPNSCPPFDSFFARRVEIELPDGVESLELRSMSGSIKASDCQGTVRAATASGDIALCGIGGEASCKTASGDIRLEKVAGAIDAHAVSGDIRLRCAPGRALEYSSVSGKVKVFGEKGARSGSIPGSASTARLSTVSGDIDVDEE